MSAGKANNGITRLQWACHILLIVFHSCSLHFSGGPPLRRAVAVWCSLPSLLSPPGAWRASELAPLAPDAPAGQAGRQVLKALAGPAGQLMFAQFVR